MFIEFADPGWDWTPAFWCGGAIVVLGIVLTIALLVAKFGNPRAWDRTGAWDGWQAFFSYGFLILGIGLTLAGPITSAIIYNVTLDSLKADALRSAGFTDIEWGRGEGEDFVGALEGRYFNGEIVSLHVDEGYKYQVVKYE